jgi:quinol monooxygenase YgiN
MHLDRVSARQAEKRDELLKVLHSFVKPSRAEPACVDYHLHVSNDDPNLFVFYENWRTRNELDEHLQTPILSASRLLLP